MHEHEKRVLEGLLFLSGDEGLSIEQLNGCVEELDKKEIEVVLDAALETLAIIAYKQPITRAEIEEIRGVSCDMMVRKLLARNLIKECGRSDAPGRPFLYEVTEEFMDTFKLVSLKELPELPDFKDTMEEELFEE